ncbi:pyruvate kinase [Suttonella sp. R2A3]|nr:pyruvate kinase [Suttonella sp. R2A3]UJF24081.1 pyruvate kinase [Suttonella sp. R2A3]
MAKNRDLTRIHHHTKIIATLGPASNSPEILEHMIRVGLNVIRLNFSHGTPEIHAENARRVREASERAGREVAIIADLQGPKVRVGKIKGDKVELKQGDNFILDAAFEGEGSAERVGLDYRALPRDVKPGDVLLLDDGLLTVTVTSVEGDEIHTEIQNDAVLKSNKGINKQGGGISAGALTDKDHEDLKTAVEIGADYLAISFVKSAADMDLARRLLAQAAHSYHRPGLIAKIERTEAIENLEEILYLCDGVMVARGDLAVEVGNAAVPSLQKKIIKKARAMRRFTITATQMMESMITNPVPTRAEVSDVANAVLDGSDAVMLSAETAVGQYPFETVRSMAQICSAAEQAQDPLTGADIHVENTSRIDHSIASGAVFTARQLNAKAIVALTESGSTAFHISRFGINIPIYALTGNRLVQRKMCMYRGVRPLMLDTGLDHQTAIQEAEAHLRWRGVVDSGDLYVITSGVTMGKPGSTNTLQISRAQ